MHWKRFGKHLLSRLPLFHDAAKNPFDFEVLAEAQRAGARQRLRVQNQSYAGSFFLPLLMSDMARS